VILTISAKCSDLCFSTLTAAGKVIFEKDGYVPDGFQIGGGDYVEINVDLTTGQLVRFKPMTHNQVQLAIEKNS
jgi:hypothetical protein